jgi:hypothetical protein
MITLKLRGRKKYNGGSFAYIDRVMEGLARSIEKTNEEFAKKERESNEAFRREMIASTEGFARKERESNEAFKKSQEEANEAFRKEMIASTEGFARKELESNEVFKKSQEEANEAFRRGMKESLAASDREFERYKKDWNKKMGDIYNRLGDLAEYTFVPEAILEKFKELDYEFDNYFRRQRIIDKDGYARAEYDVVLCNGDVVALVEIKSTFKHEYVDQFIKQIGVAVNEKYTGKQIIGAIAALEMSKEVKAYALNKGLYVIEQTGEDIRIDTQDGKFKPTTW